MNNMVADPQNKVCAYGSTNRYRKIETFFLATDF